jgi:lysophospholipase L1-like esterase
MGSHPTPSRPRRPLLARGALVLFGLGIGGVLLGGLELGVRGLFDVYRCDARLGWTFEPHGSGIKWSRQGEFLEKLEFNAQGFRDLEREPRKPPGTFRILLLGDSISAALQVPRSGSFPALLEQRLAERLPPGRRLEVVNTGTDGYGTGQELLLLRERGLRWEPDLVLLQMFVTNDVTDNWREAGDWNHYLAQRCGRPYFGREGRDLALLGRNGRPAAAGSFWDGLLRHSQLYANFVSAGLPYDPRAAFGDDNLLDPELSPPLEQAWQLTQLLVRELAREVEGRGLRFGVLLAPHKMAAGQFTEEQIQVGFPDNRFDWMQERLASFVAESGFAYLDWLPPLRRFIAETGRPAYFTFDPHLNPEGHGVVADATFEWLVERCEDLGLPIEGCANR